MVQNKTVITFKLVQSSLCWYWLLGPYTGRAERVNFSSWRTNSSLTEVAVEQGVVQGKKFILACLEREVTEEVLVIPCV